MFLLLLNQELSSNDIRNHRIVKTKTIKLSLIKQSSGKTRDAINCTTEPSLPRNDEIRLIRLRKICFSKFLDMNYAANLNPNDSEAEQNKTQKSVKCDDEIFIVPPHLGLFRKKAL